MNWPLRATCPTLVVCLLCGCDTAAPGSADPADSPRDATLTESLSAADAANCEAESCKPDAEQPPADAENPAAEQGNSGAEQEAPSCAPQPASDEVVEVSFEDLNCNMQQDVVFRPWMITDRAHELDGRRIRIAGYMLPDLKQRGITEFILLKNTQCKFGPGGQADHLIRIKLKDGVSTSYRGDIPLEVVGRLVINPFQGVDGNTWSIYDLEGESVEKYRR